MNISSKLKKYLVVLMLPLLSFSQDKNAESSYYNWFDNVLGIEHTGLYNGKQYVDLDINRIYDDKNAFFLSDKVMIGSVTYDGQTFYNQEMKYNLETDILLVTLKSSSSASIIQLINDKIDEFLIEGFRFIKIVDVFQDNTAINGFYEVLEEGASYALYKKHKKNRQKKIQAGTLVSYKFLSDNSYMLFVNENYHKITSKSEILKMYPEYKKEIKEYYNAYKALKKSDPDMFMKGLFKRIINSSSL